MTLEEYVQSIRDRISTADSTASAKAVVDEAHRTLVASNISAENQRWFWAKLYESLGTGPLIKLERQAYNSLSEIIQAAQQAIASYSASAQVKK